MARKNIGPPAGRKDLKSTSSSSSTLESLGVDRVMAISEVPGGGGGGIEK